MEGDCCCYTIFCSLSPFFSRPAFSISLLHLFLHIQKHVHNKSLPGFKGMGDCCKKLVSLSFLLFLLYVSCRTDFYLELVCVVHRNRLQTANNAPLVGLATNSSRLQEIVVGWTRPCVESQSVYVSARQTRQLVRIPSDAEHIDCVRKWYWNYTKASQL